MPNEVLNQLGVTETNDAFVFLAKTGRSVDISLKDDQEITGKDVFNFIDPLTALPAMLSGIEKIPAELKDKLTSEERKLLIETLKSSGVIDAELDVALDEGFALVSALKDFIFKYFVKTTIAGVTDSVETGPDPVIGAPTED